MPHGPAEMPEPPPKQPNWLFRIWAFAGVISALCSMAIFLCCYEPKIENGLVYGSMDRFYRIFQLVLLHFPLSEAGFETLAHQHPLGLHLLGVAQVFAVIFVVLAVVQVVGRVFGRELKAWYTVLRGNHVIICGAGRTGEVLVDEFKNGHKDSVLQIDATTDEALRKARVDKAKYLIAAMDDDGDNIAVAMQAREVAGEQPQVFIHVARPDLRALLRHQRFLQAKEGEGGPRVQLFDIYEHSARLLLRDHFLDYKSIEENDGEENDGQVVQLIVIGFGRMGEAVLTRAAMVGHYANLKRLRAKVVDLQAPLKGRQFASRYTYFGEICDVEFVRSNAEDPWTWEQVAAWCADAEKTISTVVIALDQNVLGLSLALSLDKHVRQEVPIRVRLPEQSNLTDVLGKDSRRGSLREITAFGSIREACAYENITGKKLDNMAIAVHEAYQKHQKESHLARPDDPSMREWNKLDDELRDSNRQQADHIPVKLRALNCALAPCDSSDDGGHVEFTKDEIELLAKMEHRRWMAERFLAGWRQGPKDFDERSSPYLVSWEKLETGYPKIQEIDRNFVRGLPNLVQAGGMKIYRKAHGTS